MNADSGGGGELEGRALDRAGEPPVEGLVGAAVLPTRQATSPGDPGRARLDVMLAEYNSLRQESLNAINNRITIMNFTFGALSIVLAGLLATRLPTLLAGGTALLFVPQVAKAALLIWLGEYNRSQRAGRRLQDLESSINVLVGEGAIGWETELAKRSSAQSHMSYPYLATVSLVIGAGYAGTMIGFYLLVAAAHRLDTAWIVVLVLAIAIYSLILESSFLLYFMTRWRAAVIGTTETTAGGRLERSLRRVWSRVRRHHGRPSRPDEQAPPDGPSSTEPPPGVGEGEDVW